MTLSAIAEILAERVGRQFDIPFQEELKDIIVTHRARLLTNSLQKNPAHKKYYSNSIIVELETVNKDDCAEIVECGCESVRRTVSQVPDPLKVGSNPFDYVGSPGGVKPYGWTTFSGEYYYSCNKYTSKHARYTWLNGYIYVFGDKNVEKIRIEDVFSDPRKLANFSCSATENIPCFSATSEFVTDEALVQLIIESALSKELRMQPQEEKIEVKTDQNV